MIRHKKPSQVIIFTASDHICIYSDFAAKPKNAWIKEIWLAANAGSLGVYMLRILTFSCYTNSIIIIIIILWLQSLLYIVGEKNSLTELLISYQSTSHVLTVRKPGVNIMTDFDINFTL